MKMVAQVLTLVGSFLISLSATPVKGVADSYFNGDDSDFSFIEKPSNRVAELSVSTNNSSKKEKKVVCIMVPKCGTHLLLKCLSLLDHERMPFKYVGTLYPERRYRRDQAYNKLPPPNHYKGSEHPLVEGKLPWILVHNIKTSTSNHFWHHFAYTREYDAFLDSKNALKFLMLRDPRAMLVSFAFMVKEGFEPGQEIDLESLMLDLIDGRKQHYIKWGVSRHASYPIMWEIGITEFYKTYLPFIRSKNCMVVKFEHLVGSRGGGSDDLQANEIRKIAKHVGMTASDRHIADVVTELFGGSSTFREGKIDGWKKYFTPEVTRAFKAMPGACELLIALGYEKNRNW